MNAQCHSSLTGERESHLSEFRSSFCCGSAAPQLSPAGSPCEEQVSLDFREAAAKLRFPRDSFALQSPALSNVGMQGSGWERWGPPPGQRRQKPTHTFLRFRWNSVSMDQLATTPLDLHLLYFPLQTTGISFHHSCIPFLQLHSLQQLKASLCLTSSLHAAGSKP